MLKLVEGVTGVVSSITLLGIMFMTFADVVGRNLFNHPLQGAFELTEILLAAIIFLALPHVALNGRHIVIDLLDGLLSKNWLVALDTFAAIASSSFFGLISWQMFVLAGKIYAFGDSSPVLKLPLGIIIYSISVLSLINALAFIVAIFSSHRKSKEDAESQNLV